MFFSAINATCDALKTEGFECASYIVDISDREKVYEAAKKVKEEIGKVDILVSSSFTVSLIYIKLNCALFKGQQRWYCNMPSIFGSTR